MRTPLQHKKSKKPLIITLVAVGVVLLGAAGYLAYAKQADSWPFAQKTAPSATSDQSKNATASTGDTTYGTTKTDNTPPSGSNQTSNNSGSSSAAVKQTVSVSVSSVDVVDTNVEIRAYIDGVIEGDGTCTAILTNASGAKVTGTSLGFVNATNTQCRPIEIDKSKVPSGNWSVEVDYSSSHSTGKSPSQGWSIS